MVIPKISIKVLQVWQKSLPLGKKPYDPVWVGKSENGPIILYQRGKKGEYIINLNTQDRYWCQYAFQFSHEVGHILCNYKEGNSSNLWFEETLSEVASTFIHFTVGKKVGTQPALPPMERLWPGIYQICTAENDKIPK